MNTMFLAHASTRDKRNTQVVLRKMEQFIYLEQQFSMFQCAKLLYHYGLTYADIIKTNSASSKGLTQKRLKYKENTYALSYYIITPILLFFADVFIDWCIMNNHNSLDFDKTEANIGEYCTLIKQYYQDPDYLFAMDHITNSHNELKANQSTSLLPFELDNLRMTVLEISDLD